MPDATFSFHTPTEKRSYMDATIDSHFNPELRTTIAYVTEKIKTLFGRTDEPSVIVSPYRINPLGAHIDHQGCSVLARTIDQYTILAFYPLNSSRVVLHCDNGDLEDKAAAFNIGNNTSDENWIRYAMASATSVADNAPGIKGFSGLVYGSLVGAGLSSSASVILAYIGGLAHVNNLNLSNAELVELARKVENEHMGLNNGIQDQMSIVFGRENALSLLHMESSTATYITDPPNIDDVSWVICYSGFSRELVSSGFNDRVRECREAATLLDSNAEHLGQVSNEYRSAEHLAALPAHLGRRATHVYSESLRVSQGCNAWQSGSWTEFGQLMNQSCHSSIFNYECGSQSMIDLHNIALSQPEIYGSRFGGGGYGGCLNMLVKREDAEAVKERVLNSFLERYPAKRGMAKSFIATAENNARLIYT